MPKDPYLPNSDNERIVWLKNFATQFSSIATPFGFVAADVTAINNDTAAFTYAVSLVEAGKNFAQQCTTYKDALRGGTLGIAPVVFPTFQVPAGAPIPVATGIFKRVTAIVKRIKSNSLYTEAIGRTLGVIGAELDDDLSEAKPILILSLTGGKVLVKYTKGLTDGLRLLCKRGSETEFSLLTIIAKNSFEDNRPNLTAQPETRQYCAYFIKADAVVGLISDVVSITV